MKLVFKIVYMCKPIGIKTYSKINNNGQCKRYNIWGDREHKSKERKNRNYPEITLFNYAYKYLKTIILL